MRDVPVHPACIPDNYFSGCMTRLRQKTTYKANTAILKTMHDTHIS